MRSCDCQHQPGRSAILMQISGEIGQVMQAIAAAQGRHIALPGTFNLRDVGGYPASGGTLRWRTLLRSDALHRIGAGGIELLGGVRLRTVLDLRTPIEAEIAPCVGDGLGARVVHLSILDGDLQELPAELDAIYRHMIEERGDAIGAAIRQLCAADGLPALVHCSAGKDRTGIVIALALAALGVPDEIIAADYALSGSFLDPETTAAIGQLKASSGLGDQLTAGLLGSPPELILDVLARARAAAGSADGYLLSHGVRPGELAVLRAAMIEQPAAGAGPVAR
ncbi:MAG: tyrosine-protein phosphatase [Streptosporangiaceae bacterium]